MFSLIQTDVKNIRVYIFVLFSASFTLLKAADEY